MLHILLLTERNRTDLRLTVQKLTGGDEGAGEVGQPGDQEQGAGRKEDTPDIMKS